MLQIRVVITDGDPEDPMNMYEFTIDVEPTTTIANVKAQIHEITNIPPDQQQLLLDDYTELDEDNRTVSDNYLEDGDHVFVHNYGPLSSSNGSLSSSSLDEPILPIRDH